MKSRDSNNTPNSRDAPRDREPTDPTLRTNVRPPDELAAQKLEQQKDAIAPQRDEDPNFRPANEFDRANRPPNPDSPDPGSAPQQADPANKIQDKTIANLGEHPGDPTRTSPRPGSPADKPDRPKTADEAGVDIQLSEQQRGTLRMLIHGQTNVLGIAAMTGGQGPDITKVLNELQDAGLAYQVGAGGWQATSRGAWLAGQVPEDNAAKQKRQQQQEQEKAAQAVAGAVTPEPTARNIAGDVVDPTAPPDRAQNRTLR